MNIGKQFQNPAGLLAGFFASLAVAVCLLPEKADAGSFGSLEEALRHYQKIGHSGGWPDLPKGSKLEKGVSDPRVLELQRHLLLTGDLEKKEASNTPLFDEALEQAVLLFQKRHGLTEDGIVGKATLKALNVPAGKRVGQIEANILRAKESEAIPEEEYVLVNIPAYRLVYFEAKKPVLEMRIVVGRLDWKTPVFSSSIKGILLNPTWHIPASIVKREMLPKLEKDPDYFKKEGIEIVEDRYLQRPGPENPLGRLKFIMPNPFDIYLHDTPSKNFFALSRRNLSHGCIRVENPIELALHFLNGDSRWTEKKLLSAIDAGEEKTISLPSPIPVYLIYKTVWLDDAGKVHFRADIYGKDAGADSAQIFP